MNKVRLSFDNSVSEQLSSNIIIAETSIMVKGDEILKINSNREEILKEYRNIFQKVHFNFESKIEMEAFHTTISRSVFVPLGNWICTIDHAVANAIISKNDLILIPVATRSPQICVLEAEGESQGSFLYDTNYFLPCLVEQYLKNKGFTNLRVEKRKEASIQLKKLLRGFIFIHIKFLQQLVYKLHHICFVKNKGSIKKNVIASRGIIQTHFSKNILPLFKNHDFTILVNESSIFPFRNLKYIRSLNIPFEYIEGKVPLKRTLVEYFKTLKYFIDYSFFQKKQQISFFGLEIDFNQIITEVFIFKYFSETQGLSLKEALGTQSNKKNIYCFDMLTPQPYYVKKHNSSHFTVQIQTTLMAGIEQENFVFTDKFFFTDEDTYNNHSQINPELKSKFDVLKDLKYATITKKKEKIEIDTVTFFTQPIYIEEELKIIDFLKGYFKKKNINFSLKLHPRSNQKDYSHLSLTIIGAEVDAVETIIKSDLIMTRNSTIGLDAWKLNAPVCFFVSGSVSNKGISYIPDEYKGTFKDFPDRKYLDLYLENLDTYFYQYNSIKLNEDAIKVLSYKIQNLNHVHEV